LGPVPFGIAKLRHGCDLPGPVGGSASSRVLVEPFGQVQPL
jgi:hypothetical protein